MNGKKIGYIRVSSEGQNPARQLEGVELDKYFVDYASAKSIRRTELETMLDYVREDDEVIVHSMDRLCRNLDDLRKLVTKLNNKGVRVRFVKENLLFDGADSPMSMLLLSVMGAFAEFERKIIKERQMEGIAIAKKKGVFKGRARALNSEQIEYIREQVEIGFYNVDIAKKLGVSKQTLYNYLKSENICRKRLV